MWNWLIAFIGKGFSYAPKLEELEPVFTDEEILRNFTIPRLIEDEGSRKRKGRHIIYKDTNGFWTGGFGRNFSAKGLSEEEAILLLEADCEEALTDTKSLFLSLIHI